MKAILRNTLISMLALLILSVAGCGKPDLSRSNAKSLIENSELFGELKKKLVVHEDAYSVGASLKWWTSMSEYAARRYPENMRHLMLGFGDLFEFGPDAATLAEPVTASAEVTGVSISADGISAQATFSWAYQQLPDFASFIAAEGGKGVALFRLFDDGWRLERISSFEVTPKSKYPLSESNKAAFQKFQNDLVNQEIAAKNAARQARIRMIESAPRLFVGRWKVNGGAVATYMESGEFALTNGYYDLKGRWSISNEALTVTYNSRKDSPNDVWKPLNETYQMQIVYINDSKYHIKSDGSYVGVRQ